MTSRIERRERERRDRRAAIAVDFFDLPLCIYDSQLAQCPPVKLSASLSVCLSVSQSVSAIVIDAATKKKKKTATYCLARNAITLAWLRLAWLWPKARNFDCKLICSNCQQQTARDCSGSSNNSSSHSCLLFITVLCFGPSLSGFLSWPFPISTIACGQLICLPVSSCAVLSLSLFWPTFRARLGQFAEGGLAWQSNCSASFSSSFPVCVWAKSH